MGAFRVALRVGNPRTGSSETVDALASTGATYSMMSASMLRMLGIEPVRSRPFRRWQCETVEYQTAMASFSAGGSEREASVVFGPEDQYLLGATTLEELLLTVDPIGLRLVLAEGLLL